MQLRIARYIGLFFLIAGTLDFPLWLIFIGDSNLIFEEIGIFIIIVAIPLSLVGLGLILFDRFKHEHLDHSRRKRTVATLAILINIPICIGILWLCDEIGKRSLVTIVNDSGETIQELRITAKDYQDKNVLKLTRNIESEGKAHMILNKWASHNFDIIIALNDTTITDKIAYYRMFRAQPLFDTLVLNKNFKIEYKREEERLFSKKLNQQPITK